MSNLQTLPSDLTFLAALLRVNPRDQAASTDAELALRRQATLYREAAEVLRARRALMEELARQPDVRREESAR